MVETKVLNVLVIGAVFIIAVGVTVGIGANVNDAFRSNNLKSTAVTNQTLTFTNNTLHALSGSFVTSITSVSNQSQLFTSGNYTLTAGIDSSVLNISISCGGDGAAGSGNCSSVGSTLNVSYVVNQKTGASLAANNATAGLGNLNLPSIGTVVGVVVIISIIALALGIFSGGGFGRGRRTE